MLDKIKDNQIREAVAKATGKDINEKLHLEDILRTIDINSKYDYEILKLLHLWDLSKSYEDQKDEVKEFIFNLLFK